MSEQRILATAATAGNGTKNGPAVAAPPQSAVPGKSILALAGRRKWLVLAVVLVAGGLALLGWWMFLRPPQLPPGFASSNGRIEATEIDVATKLAGRIVDELVDEGDFITAHQELAHMDTDVLRAELREAQAKKAMSKAAVETATSTKAQRESEKAAADAVQKQREAEFDLASKNFARAQQLVGNGTMSKEEFDSQQSVFYSSKAAVNSAKANVHAAEAAVSTAQALIIAAQSNVDSSQATIDRVQADIDQMTLWSPRAGRVQYRIAQPGEVMPAGGKVLNMIDLSDVYMTFFLPEAQAGRIRIGTEVRLVLDAAPDLVIPARVTFVADVAQFTPKTVETAQERQKLTFRIKAHIPPELLQKYIRDVKTGLPGVAYVQLDPQAEWPANLQVKLPEK